MRLLVSTFMILFSFMASADEQGDKMILKDVEVFLKNNDLDSVKSYMEKLGDNFKVAEAYDNLVKNLYWADKGATNLIKVGKIGVDFCLENVSKEPNETLKYDLKSWAKTIAYDVGANSWPFWGDEGVVITKEDMREGLKFSLLNLKLGIELNKPKNKIAMAYWLVGAHYLAQSELEQSKENFEKSKEISLEIKDELYVILADGFLSIVQIKQIENEENRKAFDLVVKKLQDLNTEDSKFYAQQLKTVLALSSNI